MHTSRGKASHIYQQCVHFAGGGLTGMIPAAPSGAASPPRAVEIHGVPVAETVLVQNVGSQVTDLQPGKLPLKLIEGHPGGFNYSNFVFSK